MNKPPLIRAVKAEPPAKLEIVWANGKKLTVDVSRLIKRFKLYTPLRKHRAPGDCRHRRSHEH